MACTFSSNCIRRTKNLEHAIYDVNVDEYDDIQTQWISYYIKADYETYSDCYDDEYFKRDFKNHCMFLQAYVSVTCRFFSIGWINFDLRQ